MKIKKFIKKALLVVLAYFCIQALCAAAWYIRKYGDTGFMSIISTFMSPWKGCANTLKQSYRYYVSIPTYIITALFALILFYRGKLKLVIKEKQIYPFTDKWSTWICVIVSITCLTIAMCSVHFPTYLYDTFLTQSTLYEEEYVDPRDVTITFPEEKRNLVYIYLESMETSYLSKELGGGSTENLIPELYDLAMENINFSHSDGVGGWPRVTHATWTSAAMVSQTSGVPLTVDIKNIDLSNFRGYLPGAVNLQNILHDAGYYQTLMVGSDGSFGGRKEYFEDHGADHVYDLYTAREDGIIPEDYMVWWGFEDVKLFDYAKQELTKIAAGDQPFAFTLLTVDTHHVDGYFCELCGKDHSEQYSNVLSCSSRQVLSFVQWLQEQDFYENTTVIICGDHPSMDNQYFVRNISEDYERHVYNCIINSPIEANNTKNRVFTPMDMFPTTLAALGCEISGDRLGLGTNLFSETPTVAERIGIEKLNREISKYSEYYSEKLIGES